MSQEIEVTLDQRSEVTDTQIQLPINYQEVGKVGSLDIRIYVQPGTLDEIDRFAAVDTSKERGGVLVGRMTDHSGKINLVIDGFIIATHTDSTSVSLTFTSESWSAIHEERASQYPESKIVGWFHTHPGYGIFLSSHDLFIHQNFFNYPWAVAYVVDPKAKTRGFFAWKAGEIVECTGFHIYDEPGQALHPERYYRPSSQKIASSEQKSDGNGIPSDRTKTAVLGMILVAIILSSLLFFMLNSRKQENRIIELSNRLSEMTLQQEESDRAVGEMSENLERLQSKISDLEANAHLASPDTSKDETNENVFALDPNIMFVGYRSYRVEKGDSLLNILAKHQVSEDKYNLTLGVNGISNPDFIMEDQILYIPVVIENGGHKNAD